MGRLRGMQLTMRDIEILRFINGFGFCEMSHVSQHFNLRNPRKYQILSRLIKAGLVKAEKTFFAHERILMVTQEGTKHTNLPALKKFSYSNYQHTVHLINVYLKLSKMYPEAMWKGEREIIQEGLKIGNKKYQHAPDAFLMFPGDTKIAIEVELSAKARARWERIAQTYSYSFDVKEVWYFCHRSILRSLQKTLEKWQLFKVLDINEFLSHGSGWECNFHY